MASVPMTDSAYARSSKAHGETWSVARKLSINGLRVLKADFSPGFPVGLLILLVLVASVEDFPYSLGASFADLARTFSGANTDVLPGSHRAFAEISAGFAGVQSSEITGRSGSALAQAPRSLGGSFANVLTAFAHLLTRAGASFLILLRLVLRPGLRLDGPLILSWIRGPRKG